MNKWPLLTADSQFSSTDMNVTFHKCNGVVVVVVVVERMSETQFKRLTFADSGNEMRLDTSSA